MSNLHKGSQLELEAFENEALAVSSSPVTTTNLWRPDWSRVNRTLLAKRGTCMMVTPTNQDWTNKSIAKLTFLSNKQVNHYVPIGKIIGEIQVRSTDWEYQ